MYLNKSMVGCGDKFWMRKIQGISNIPKENIGFIVAANHASYLDHFILGSTIVLNTKKMLHFLAKKEHFDDPFQRRWHNFLNAIPIDRQAGGRKAIKKAIAALKNKKAIAIYPEGTRTLTGKLNHAKTGIARLALAAKVPVLPVGLVGTFDILPKGNYFPKFKRSEVNVGKLMYFDKYYKKEKDYKTLRFITDKIMKEIAKLSKQNYNPKVK